MDVSRRRRAGAAVALASLCLASACTAPETPGARPGAEEPPSAAVTAGPGPSETSARILPPVAQPGASAAAAAEAARVVAVTVVPAVPGRTVALEQQGDLGWQAVGTTEQDALGRASIPLPAELSEVVPLRVVTADSAGEVVLPVTGAGSWAQAFDDEFTSGFDTTRWDYRQLGLFQGNRSRAASSPLAVGVGGGLLTLRTMRHPELPTKFVNGHVSTERSFAFRYGMAAARIRFQRERGQHGAFWLQPSSPLAGGTGPQELGAEIDVAEYFGEGFADGGLAQYIHFQDDTGAPVKEGGLLPDETDRLPSGSTWWNSFHVFSVEWSPDAYVFRIDGVETWRTSAGVSGIDEYLILSLLNSDWELEHLDRSRLPAEMSVDWVRVWTGESRE